MSFYRLVIGFQKPKVIFFFSFFILLLLSKLNGLSQTLVIEYPIGGETFHNKSTISIKWKNEFENSLVLIEYSIDKGKNWNIIDTSRGSIYYWSIPNELNSENCIIRVSLVDKIKYFENVLTLKSHTNWINSIALGKGTNYIASGGLDNTVKLWNKNDGTLVRTFLGHTNQINSVKFSPNNDYLISGSSDSSLKIWNIETGENILTLLGHKDIVRCVDVSSDSKYIVSSSNDSTIKIWDLYTGVLVKTIKGHTGWVIDVKYFNNKSIISCGSDKTIKLWNFETSENLSTFIGHNDNVNSVCFSKDEKVIVSASSDNSIKMWDVESGNNFRTLIGHKFHVVGVDYNLDNSNLVSCSFDSTIKIWDPLNGKNIFTFKGHNGWVRDVQYDFNGQRFYSCGFDSVIKRWDIRHLYYNTLSSLFTIKDVFSSVFENEINAKSYILFFNNQIQLNFKENIESDLSLIVVDLNGKIISEYMNLSSKNRIDLSKLFGVHFVVLKKNEEIIEVKKCLVVK